MSVSSFRRASVTFILISLFIDALGSGLVIPILPKLVERLIGGEISDASFAASAAAVPRPLATLRASAALS